MQDEKRKEKETPRKTTINQLLLHGTLNSHLIYPYKRELSLSFYVSLSFPGCVRYELRVQFTLVLPYDP